MSDTTTTYDLAQQNIALLQRHLDAINAWDFDSDPRDLPPGDRARTALRRRRFPKVDAGLRRRDGVHGGVPDFAEAENLHDFSIHAFADDPNELVAEYLSDMTLKNGRPYQNTYVVRATVHDGKLICSASTSTRSPCSKRSVAR